MGVLDIVLLVILLLSSLFIVIAVLFQKSSEEGLSGSIAGGNGGTYYGKDKSGGSQRMWVKWTAIIAIIFAIAVAVVYIIQPDYDKADAGSYTNWQSMLNTGNMKDTVEVDGEQTEVSRYENVGSNLYMLYWAESYGLGSSLDAFLN